MEENLIGRYLKVLQKNRGKHQYLLINHKNDTGTYRTKEYPEECMNIAYRIRIEEFELMPLGFHPDNINILQNIEIY